MRKLSWRLPPELRPAWLTALSGLLIVAAFPPWDLSFLIWVSLIPWFFALKHARSFRATLAQGVWLGFFMSLGGFFWIAYVLHQFGGLPWILAGIGLFLFAWFCQPQFAFFAALSWFTWKRRPLAPHWLVATALAYAAIDWILPKLFVDTLGHSLYLAPHLRQAADLGGAPLLTFLIILTNLALAECLYAWRHQNHGARLLRTAPALAIAVALVTGAWVYGFQREKEISSLLEQAPQRLRSAVIQGNIGDIEKLAAEQGLKHAAEGVLNTYFRLSDEALTGLPRPDFLVWPETAYPSTFRTPVSNDERTRDGKVESFVRSRGVPLLFGGYDRDMQRDFNAFYVLSPQALEDLGRPEGTFTAGDLQVYHKHVLLPFGEFIPGTESIQLIRSAFPQVGYFGRGPGPEVLSVPVFSSPSIVPASALTTESPQQASHPTLIRISPIICYEALFSDYVIAAARKGSQLILNITNDSWFGPFGEPQLHLALTTFRSIETRLPQLRATNTGISALILPTGEIRNRTEIGRPEIMHSEVPITDPVPTLVKAWGDWFTPFASAFGLVPLLWLAWRQRAQRNLPNE